MSSLHVVWSTGLVLSIVGLAAFYDVTRNPLGYSIQFRRARVFNWLIVGVAYSVQLMSKYNFYAMNSSEIRSMLSMSMWQFGVVLLIVNWAYAMSLLFNGYIIDRVGNPKRTMLIGLGGTTVINLLFALVAAMRSWYFLSPFVFILLFLQFGALNSYFKSFGPPSAAKLNSGWYMKYERGTFSGLFGIVQGLGYHMALVSNSVILDWLPWYSMFLVTSVLALTMFVVMGYFVKDKPPQELTKLADPYKLQQSGGLGPLQEELIEDDSYSFEEPTTPVGESQRRAVAAGMFATLEEQRQMQLAPQPSLKELLQDHRLVVFCGAMFCYGLVREGFNAWVMTYMEDQFSVKTTSAAHTAVATAVTLGSTVGSLAAGCLADTTFCQRRTPLAVGFFLLAAFGLASFFWSYTLVNAVLWVFLIALCIFGLQGFRQIVSADAGKSVASVTGLLAASQYFGSGMSGIFFGIVIQLFGYGMWIFSLVVLCGLGVAILTLYRRMTPKGQLWSGTPPVDRPFRDPGSSSDEPRYHTL